MLYKYKYFYNCLLNNHFNYTPIKFLMPIRNLNVNIININCQDTKKLSSFMSVMNLGFK